MEWLFDSWESPLRLTKLIIEPSLKGKSFFIGTIYGFVVSFMPDGRMESNKGTP